jgi:phospholipid/cholesterol/gamma-HCH transport system ATP-binding protein
MTGCAIECRRVRKGFGSKMVLDGVELAIPEGMITVVLGPSGTGKSVLLKHMVGLMFPDEGEVLVQGRPLGSMHLPELLALRKRTGILFQDGALWSSLNLYDNIAFPLRRHTDLSERRIAEVVTRRLAEVGLSDAGKRMPSELSGGMRKRAGLARALVLDPEIVLVDEPDSGLDPVRTSLLCDLLLDLHHEYGGTYVVITHDLATIRRIGQHLVVLWAGRIVQAGAAHELFASEHPFVRQFLKGETQGPLGMDE